MKFFQLLQTGDKKTDKTDTLKDIHPLHEEQLLCLVDQRLNFGRLPSIHIFRNMSRPLSLHSISRQAQKPSLWALPASAWGLGAPYTPDVCARRQFQTQSALSDFQRYCNALFVRRSFHRPVQLRSREVKHKYFSTSRQLYQQQRPPTNDDDKAAKLASLIPDQPDLTSHFTTFAQTYPAGPPPSGDFFHSPSTLKREFLSLQSRLHPDKYGAGPAKLLAESLSARVNDAYRTLVDPLTRAQYILHTLYDIDLTAESRDIKNANPETLAYVMEMQETLEEVADAGDEKALDELRMENEGCIETCVENVGKALNEGNAKEAAEHCVRLKFLYSVRQVVDGVELDGKPGPKGLSRLMH